MDRAFTEALNRRQKDKLQRVLVLVFLLSTAFAILVPVTAPPLKYTLIPASLFLLYPFDAFAYMLFPLSFLSDSIGSYFVSGVTLRLIHIALMFWKIFFRRKTTRIDRSTILFMIVTAAYFGYAALSESMSQVLNILITASLVLISEKHIHDERRLNALLYVIYMTALLSAVTLTFGLAGVREDTERVIGIGYDDANYSSLICIFGLSALLNVRFRTLKTKVFQFVGCSLFVTGVFRSGSRAGLIVIAFVFLLKLLLTKGIAKRAQYLALLLVVLLIGYWMVSTGMITFSNSDAMLDRWQSTIVAIENEDFTKVSAHRNVLFERYINYYFEQSGFAMLFGGNVPSSKQMLEVGEGFATHNVFVDYLLAAGLIGSLYFFYYYFRRTLRYYRIYLRTHNTSYLAVVIMKISGLTMGATLALWASSQWWFFFIL